MAAIPLATVTKFCSATPTCTNLSGYLPANKCIWVLSVRSAQSPTTFLFSSPASKSPSPKPLRIGACSTSASNILGLSFKFWFSIVFLFFSSLLHLGEGLGVRSTHVPLLFYRSRCGFPQVL